MAMWVFWARGTVPTLRCTSCNTCTSKEVHSVDFLTRRRVVRVPYPDVEYRRNETSFRRLPKHVRLPTAYELWALYHMTTNLKMIERMADCANHSVSGVNEDFAPMSYSMLAPLNWSPKKEHPYMVVLPGHRSLSRDFEDVCANFFERSLHRQLMTEQE